MPELTASLPPLQSQAINPRRPLLAGIFRALDEAGAGWCIPHGQEQWTEDAPLDVDCIVERTFGPQRLVALLRAREGEFGARIVQWLDDGAQWIVLATNESPPRMLQLHVSYDYELDGRVFYTGEEILGARRGEEDVWIAAPAIEFGCVLVNRVFKCRLDEQRQKRLTLLFATDAQGCSQQINRFFTPDHVRLISMAARTGDWVEVVDRLCETRGDLRTRVRTTGHVARLTRRVKRWLNPDTGLHMVFLGPDGAGKSTLIDGVRDGLSNAFLRTDYFTFAPSFIPTPFQPRKEKPHGLPPRSYAGSLLKAAWWAVCYSIGYRAAIHAARARGALVLNHRYLLDAIVDPRRYRYAGPIWLLHWIWKIAQQPDLVILLDADAEVIWARKKELPLEEIRRQRDAYRALVEPLTLTYGHIVDASMPANNLIADVNHLVLDLLAARVARRIPAEAHT